MRLSAIIPTWQEEARIGEAVAAARAIADEVVVSDGGSTDRTAAIARSMGARVVQEVRGRGHQLAAGADHASGDVLLFLHADTVLPVEARAAVERALQDPQVCGGNFFVRFEPEESEVARLFTWLYDLRRRALGIYYGDSPMFVRKDVYRRLGGFPSQPLFEDYAFIRRMERSARTRYVRHVHAVTSGRRYENRVLRTVARWVALQTLFSLGVSSARLARWYGDAR
jgi:rSAM/selenodomain-associated transferase 2